MFAEKTLIRKKNHEYWMNRAGGYSKVNREELDGIQRRNWSLLLDHEIKTHFGTYQTRDEIRILDTGAGPGFFSIILTELGYRLTAADFAGAMLEEARTNAGSLAASIDFRVENAMDLSFEDGSFDVVISRNLTWNLPEPENAYAEWLRVLKPNGLLLVFDANWYAYLRDMDMKTAYDQDRENVRQRGYSDYNIGENFDVMERIADHMPLTGMKRPSWDRDILKKLGAHDIMTIDDIGRKVYSDKEKINYASTPMFMIKVVK